MSDDPFENIGGTEQLLLRTLSPNGNLHGYDLRTDVGEHYTIADVMFLAAVGELPSNEQSQRVREFVISEISETSKSPMVFTGILARVSGASVLSASAVVATSLAAEIDGLPEDDQYVELGMSKDQFGTLKLMAMLIAGVAELSAWSPGEVNQIPQNLPEFDFED